MTTYSVNVSVNYLFNVLNEVGKYDENDIVHISHKLFYSVSQLGVKKCQDLLYLRCLQAKDDILMVKSGNYKHTVKLKNKWIFNIILLSSAGQHISQMKEIDSRREYFVSEIVLHIIENLKIMDSKTVFLLKSLLQIVDNQKIILNMQQSKFIVNKMNTMYCSNISEIRSLSFKIIKILEPSIQQKSIEQIPSINLVFRYEDHEEFLNKFSYEKLCENIPFLMSNIIRLFQYNFYSKKVGAIYRVIIEKLDFNDFECKIWPIWATHIYQASADGEFYQAMLKYWIPYTVKQYQSDLYYFLSEQNDNHRFIIDILYESRRKGFIGIEDLQKDSTLNIILQNLSCPKTYIKTFKIVSIFLNSSEEINKDFLNIVEEFISKRIKSKSLHCIEKSFKSFLSHLVVIQHIRIIKVKYIDDNCKYSNFIKNIITISKNGLMDKESFDGASKVWEFTMDILTSSLNKLPINYTINKKFNYENNQNLFYLYLRENCILNFYDDKFINLLTDHFIKCPEDSDNTISLLTTKYKHLVDLKFIKANIPKATISKMSINDLNIYKMYWNIILHCSETKEVIQIKIEFINHIMEIIKKLEVEDEVIMDIFICLRKMEVVFLAPKLCSISKLLDPIAADMLEYLVKVVDQKWQERLTVKNKKILEALLCHFLEAINHTLDVTNAYNFLLKLKKLIEKANMKSVVTSAVTTIQLLSGVMTSEPYLASKKLFFHNLLESICTTNCLPTSKMRKHPEIRSVLHAVCRANITEKYFVHFALSALIKNISETTSTASLVLSLECLEILLNDSDLYRCTIPFVEEVLQITIKHIEQQNWVLRNTSLQLTKSMLDRVLGISDGVNLRLRSIQEMCIIYPSTVSLFYDVLKVSSSDEQTLIVLQYFSCSQIQEQNYTNEFTRKMLRLCLKHFFDSILTQKYYIAKHYIQAYTCTCLPSKVELHLEFYINYLITNFTNLSMSSIYNIFFCIKELSLKLNFYDKVNYSIGNLLVTFRKFISKLNLGTLDFYCIPHNSFRKKVLSIEHMHLKTRHSFLDRIYLKNNLPDLLKEILPFQLPGFIRRLLTLNLPLISHLLLVKCTKKLFFQYNYSPIRNVILEIFVNYFLSMDHLKSDIVVVRTYAEAIVDFADNTESESNNLVLHLRSSYLYSISFYKAVVGNIILAKSHKQSCDSNFIDASFLLLTDISQNDYNLEIVSQILCHLVDNVISKYKNNFVNFLILLLLRNDEFYHVSVSKCIAKMFNIDMMAYNNCFQIIIDFHNLEKYLGDTKSVEVFLNNLNKTLEQYLKKITDNNTYYFNERDLVLRYKKLVERELTNLKISQ